MREDLGVVGKAVGVVGGREERGERPLVVEGGGGLVLMVQEGRHAATHTLHHHSSAGPAPAHLRRHTWSAGWNTNTSSTHHQLFMNVVWLYTLFTII